VEALLDGAEALPADADGGEGGGEQHTPPDEERGLYGKYRITKADGSPVDPFGEWFVLRYDNEGIGFDDEVTRAHRAASREALGLYARLIRRHLPKLASDLDNALAAFGYEHRYPTWGEICHINASLTLNGISFTVTSCDQKKATLKTFDRANAWGQKWTDCVQVGTRYEIRERWFIVRSMNDDPENKNSYITIVPSIAPPDEWQQGTLLAVLDSDAPEDEDGDDAVLAEECTPTRVHATLKHVQPEWGDEEIPLDIVEQWSEEELRAVGEWASDADAGEMPDCLVTAIDEAFKRTNGDDDEEAPDAAQ
jgi:hypothetical protein